jgi:small subunit ribosomal protein S3
MGRKVNPIGFRLKVNRTWDGRWYAEGDNYVQQLHQDIELREMIRKDSPRAGISRIEIERFPGKIKIIVHTAKPGVFIGRKGENVKRTRRMLESIAGMKIDLDIKEIKEPDMDALLVAENIAGQLERRISFSRAMKRAIRQTMRQGAEGIRVQVAGRLTGAEMARTIHMREGRVPRQTLRADIDYALAEATTTYGQIGV